MVGFEPIYWGLEDLRVTINTLPAKFGTQRGIRTHTFRFLRPLPLPIGLFGLWCRHLDSNQRPTGYEPGAAYLWAIAASWYRVVESNHWPSACKADAHTPELTRCGTQSGIRTRSVSNVADFKSAAFHQFRHLGISYGTTGRNRTRILDLEEPCPVHWTTVVYIWPVMKDSNPRPLGS